MANAEHLEILKQGVEVWNRWREENPDIRPDLSRAALTRANLPDIDLSEANLSRVRLQNAYLARAVLVGANFAEASLVATTFSDANLERAYLVGAELTGASFESASLTSANFTGANLMHASLVGAGLRSTNFAGAILPHADLTGAELHGTILGHASLAHAHGLETARHEGPSTINGQALINSRGQLSSVFLRGCGLSDWEIEASKLFNSDLRNGERTDIAYEILRLQGENPIQINPLFISYSHANAAFVEALEVQLDRKHIRFWRDVHDMKAGRTERQIDCAIRHNPTVLLILSERSVESDWVEWEASMARELEKELKRDVLCPIALDDSWEACNWPGPLRRQIEDYHILDFSEWQDADAFNRQFQKLIDGLGLFYPKASGE